MMLRQGTTGTVAMVLTAAPRAARLVAAMAVEVVAGAEKSAGET